jgi:hypothetical protein
MERAKGKGDCEQSVWACLKTFTTHSYPPLRYFCSLNLNVSHRIIQGNDCFLSLCAIVFRSPPASHVSTSNGQWSSQLFCVHYTTPDKGAVPWLRRLVAGLSPRSPGLSRVNLCGICGGQSVTGTDSEFLCFPLSVSFYRRSPHSYIIRGMNNMSVSGSSSET